MMFNHTVSLDVWGHALLFMSIIITYYVIWDIIDARKTQIEIAQKLIVYHYYN